MNANSMTLRTTLMRAEVTHGIHYCVIEAGLTPGLFQPVPIRLYIDKLERVGGYELEVNQLVPRLEQAGDAAARIQAEMVSTLGADLEVVFEVFLEDGLPAAFALLPQPFGAHVLLR